MKRLLTAICVIAGCATLCCAQTPIKFSLDTAVTNAAATAAGSVTNDASAFLYGYVDAIEVDLSGYASPTVTVTFVTAGGDGSGTARTLYSKEITADTGLVYVRGIASTTAGAAIANEPVRIPVAQDRIIMQAYGANVTNTIGVTGWVWID